MALQLPPLRQVPLSDVLKKKPPTPRIKTDEDLEFWKRTRSYRDLGLFLQRLNEAVVGHHLPFTPQSPSEVDGLLSSTPSCWVILEYSVWLPFFQSSTN